MDALAKAYLCGGETISATPWPCGTAFVLSPFPVEPTMGPEAYGPGERDKQTGCEQMARQAW